jgi:hypothetical protein
MKKIIIFFILTAYLLPQASAQQVKFGVEAGGNWSHYKNDKSKAEQVGSMGGGFQLGGTVDYEFKHHWMLMSGLTWMQTRSTFLRVSCFLKRTGRFLGLLAAPLIGTIKSTTKRIINNFAFIIRCFIDLWRQS